MLVPFLYTFSTGISGTGEKLDSAEAVRADEA